MKNTDKIFWLALLGSINFLAPVVTLFYIHRGLNLQQIFILLLVIVVTMFIFEIPTGIFGDKYGRKNSIVVGYFLLFVASILLIFAHSFMFFIFLSFLAAVAFTFISGSDEALIYESLKEEGKQGEMKKYMSRLNAADYIPLIITAPIGGIIAKNLLERQFVILLILSAVIALVVFFLSLTLKEVGSDTIGSNKLGKKKKNAFQLFRSSLKDIRKSPVLVRLFINKTLVLIVCSHIFGNLWQPYLLESKVPVIIFGFLISFCAMGIVYLNMNIEKIEKHVSSKTILYVTVILPFLAFLLGAFLRNIIYAIIFYFVVRLSLELRNPIFSHYINQHIKSHNRATVLSSLSMVDSLFDVLIFVSIGFASRAGLTPPFLLSAFILLVAVLFFRIADEHIRDKTINKRQKFRY